MNLKSDIHVFILGARGYTQNYGGWEALVHGLIDNWKNERVKFYVFEKVNSVEDEGIFELPNVTCIRIAVEKDGGSAMMIFDAKCTEWAYEYIKNSKIVNPIMYYLGLRIGVLVWLKRYKLKKQGIVIMENPAGLEWKRTKWNKLVQIYAYVSAHFMAHAVDYMICDAEEIRNVYNKMIHTKRPEKLFIAYGTYEVEQVNAIMPTKVVEFFEEWSIQKDNYYLILGRFIPENNYEMMLKGFISSATEKKLVIVTNYKTEIQSFYQHILETTKFDKDERVKMVGTIYDKELLHYLRQYARGYIHGHSVGGTNPGLLEAMSETKINILYGCPFNKEVGSNAGIYFNDEFELQKIINQVDCFTEAEMNEYENRAKNRMRTYYSWDHIVNEYERLFTSIF